MSQEFESSATPEITAQDTTIESQQEQPSITQGADAELDAIFKAHTEDDDTKPDPDAQAEQPTQEEGKTGDDSAESKAEQPTESAKLEAPNTWNKEEKAAWEQAPDAVKMALHRRAQQVEAWAKSHGEEFTAAKNFGETMRPIAESINELRPYLEGVQGTDGSPLWGNPQAIAGEIKALAQVKADLMRDPAQGLKNIINWARSNGFDMNAALASVVQDVGNWQDDSTVRAQAEAERYRQRAEALERERSEYTQRQEMERHVVGASQQINSLADAVGQDGTPVYPHMHNENAEAIGRMMGAFLRANVGPHGLTQQVFNDAYQSAVWGHAPTRSAEQARLESERVEKFKQNSERARKAAGIVPNGSVTNAPRIENMNADEAMEAVWNQHHEGR